MLKYLGQPHETKTVDSPRDSMQDLIKGGLIKGYTITDSGGNKQEAYHLTGRGRVERGRVQGHGWLERNLARFSSAIFILFGLTFLFYQDLIFNGNVIGSKLSSSLDIAFIFSLLLIIIGAALFFLSIKK